MAVNEGGRPRRISRSAVAVGRALVAGLAVVVMAASGTAWWLLGQADDQLQSNAVAALYPDDPNIRTAPVSAAAAQSDGTADPGDTAGAAENILILGLDTRPPSQTAPGTGTSQSDVIMIAHVSADRQRVDLVSIPRDLMITAPTCKAWDYSSGTLSDRDFDNPYSEWKITNAYAVGGPTCTIKAVQALTGVRIDRLIVFNFEGFKKIVDAMGGVTMTFPGPSSTTGRPSSTPAVPAWSMATRRWPWSGPVGWPAIPPVTWAGSAVSSNCSAPCWRRPAAATWSATPLGSTARCTRSSTTRSPTM